MDGQDLKVGRVLRASTRGFIIGCAVMQPDIPAFGSFVQVDGPAPGSIIYGLIYDVSTEDDLFVRQLVSTRPMDEEFVLDQRENRQVPIEVSVLTVGCGDGEMIRQCLPPQPPVTLDWLYVCTHREVRAFTNHTDFFQLVLEAREVPTDELLAACLRIGAAARPEETRRRFLIEAGRELARLLAADPVRLEGLLRRLRP